MKMKKIDTMMKCKEGKWNENDYVDACQK